MRIMDRVELDRPKLSKEKIDILILKDMVNDKGKKEKDPNHFKELLLKFSPEKKSSQNL